MSTAHCSSCRNFQACTSWLSCGFERTAASLRGAGSRELVLLGAVCWHCCATSMTQLMFPHDTLLLGSPSAPAQQCTVPCECVLGSLAKIILFLPAHTMATVQYPAAIIEKEGHYKRMQLTVLRSLYRRRAGSWKSERELSFERALRLETVSMGILLCTKRVCAWARFSKETKYSGNAPMLKNNQQGT